MKWRPEARPLGLWFYGPSTIKTVTAVPGGVGWGWGGESGVPGREVYPSKLSALFFLNKNTPVMKSTAPKRYLIQQL
jgi:hypothetical protein